MNSTCNNILDRIYRIFWIEWPSAEGHPAGRRQKNSTNPANPVWKKKCKSNPFSTQCLCGEKILRLIRYRNLESPSQVQEILMLSQRNNWRNF